MIYQIDITRGISIRMRERAQKWLVRWQEMLSRIWLSCLLIVAVFFSFRSLNKSILGATTVTSLQTVTTTVTSTSSSFTTIGTSYSTQTVQPPPLSTTINLPAVPQKYRCWYDYRSFTALKDQHAKGQLKSTSAISFYIVSQTNLDSFRESCTVGDWLFAQEGTLGATFEVNINSDGPYDFVFVNFSHIRDVSIDFYAETGASAIRTQAFPVFSTSIRVHSFSVTQTLSLTVVQDSSDKYQSTNMLTNPNLLLGWFMVVFSVYALYWIVKRRRSRGEKSEGGEGDTVVY